MRVAVFCALLLGVTLAVYSKLGGCDFVGYDDGDYFYQNPRVLGGLSLENVGWAFKTTFASNWHPLTWLSHMLDAQIFGTRPGWAHLVNVLFHAANSALLFLALQRMTKAFWRSGFVAGLFALHPQHVESVAWISERKDVLSAFFFMLTLLAYARYIEHRSSRRKEALISLGSMAPEDKSLITPAATNSQYAGIWYALALVLFALGLMCKPMLVTLPFLLLLLDYWPLARLDVPRPAFGKLLLEKLPFLLLTAASCAVTFVAQQRGGAVESLEHVPLEGRLANAVVAYAAYLFKMFWPSKLAILYLRPDVWPVWQIALSAIVLFACTAVALALPTRRPYLAVGWLWYLGTLMPVIGLVQVGNQFMADRYAYLPSLGCFIIIAWGGWDLAQRLRLNRQLVFAVGAAILILCGAITFRQTGYWRDTETLFGHCLAVTKDNYVAHNILGAWLGPRGQFEEAKAHFQAALRLAPGHADALSNLGVLLAEHGDYGESLGYLREAVRLQPRGASVFAKLALALDGKAPVDQVLVYYREALRQFPDDVQSCNNLAWLLATSADPKNRDADEAVELAERACTLTGFNQAPLLGTLAAAYAEAGRFDDATQTAQKALKLAEATGQTALTETNRQLLELYRAGKPFHERQ
jgi:tetratricopeptide (TPR) repeat protein